MVNYKLYKGSKYYNQLKFFINYNFVNNFKLKL